MTTDTNTNQPVIYHHEDPRSLISTDGIETTSDIDDRICEYSSKYKDACHKESFMEGARISNYLSNKLHQSIMAREVGELKRIHEEKVNRLLDQIDILKNSNANLSKDLHMLADSIKAL